MSTASEPLSIEFSSGPTGHYVTCGGRRALLSDAQAAEVAASLLSARTAPISIELTAVRNPSPADLRGLRAASPAPAASPSSPASPAEPDDGPFGSRLIDLEHLATSAQEALDLTAPDVRIVAAGREWAERLGVSTQQIVEVCLDPEDEWLSADAHIVYVVGQDIGLSLSTKDGAVLSVRPAEDMGSFKRHLAPDRGTPRGRGGSGTRYPNDPRALRELLTGRGFEVELVNRGHYRVSRPGGSSMHISATPSDYRTLINEIKKIERHFGVSLAKEA